MQDDEVVLPAQLCTTSSALLNPRRKPGPVRHSDDSRWVDAEAAECGSKRICRNGNSIGRPQGAALQPREQVTGTKASACLPCLLASRGDHILNELQQRPPLPPCNSRGSNRAE